MQCHQRWGSMRGKHINSSHFSLSPGTHLYTSGGCFTFLISSSSVHCSCDTIFRRHISSTRKRRSTLPSTCGALFLTPDAAASSAQALRPRHEQETQRWLAYMARLDRRDIYTRCIYCLSRVSQLPAAAVPCLFWFLDVNGMMHLATAPVGAGGHDELDVA